MGISRSTFYDARDAGASDVAVVAEMKAICDEFEAYGYRRVAAELRHRGMVVNAKKVRRLMREHALNPKRRRRFVATTDSNHNYPVFPDLANNMAPVGPNQLWVPTSPMSQSRLASCTWPRSSMPGPVGSLVTPSAERSMRAWSLLRSKPPSTLAIQHGVACIIPTVDHSTPPNPIVRFCASMAS
jgi:helix-turn-helix protein